MRVNYYFPLTVFLRSVNVWSHKMGTKSYKFKFRSARIYSEITVVYTHLSGYENTTQTKSNKAQKLYTPLTKTVDELESGAALKIHWTAGLGKPSAWQNIVAVSPSETFTSRGEITMIGGSM